MTSTNHHVFCLKKHFIMNLLNNKNYLCKKIIWRKKQVAKHQLIVLNAFFERVKIMWKKTKKLQYGHLMIFDNIKKKHDVYKEKDCMKKFCEYLQDEAIKH